MSNEKFLRVIDLTIVSGTSVTITVPPQFLKNGKCFDLLFCLSEPDQVKFSDLIEGNEVVTIKNGVSGIVYVLETNAGNIFYADRLHLGFCYRLRWGNNGAAATDGSTGAVQHFINLNTPRVACSFNPENNVIPPVV